MVICSTAPLHLLVRELNQTRRTNSMSMLSTHRMAAALAAAGVLLFAVLAAAPRPTPRTSSTPVRSRVASLISSRRRRSVIAAKQRTLTRERSTRATAPKPEHPPAKRPYTLARTTRAVRSASSRRTRSARRAKRSFPGTVLAPQVQRAQLERQVRQEVPEPPVKKERLVKKAQR